LCLSYPHRHRQILPSRVFAQSAASHPILSGPFRIDIGLLSALLSDANNVIAVAFYEVVLRKIY
jgi:hypothetical protein